MQYTTRLRWLFGMMIMLFSGALVSAQQYEFYPCDGTASWSEDFSGNPSWTVLDLDSLTPRPATGLNPGWQFITDLNNPGNQLPVSASWYTLPDSSDDWLISPSITLPSGNVCLSWLGVAYDELFPEEYEVYISTTGTDTADFFANPALRMISGENGNYTYRSANLSGYAGQTVHLAFRQTSFDKYILGIDEVKIATVDMLDIGVDSLESAAADTNAPVSFEGVVGNYGSDTVTSFELYWSVEGGSPTVETIDSIVLNPNMSYRFSLDSAWQSSQEGFYEICFWTNLPNNGTDEEMANDTACVVANIGGLVGMEDLIDGDFPQAYPNPTEALLTIEAPFARVETWQVSIQNLNGQTLQSLELPAGQKQIIDLHHFPKGILLLTFAAENHRKTLKILHQ